MAETLPDGTTVKVTMVCSCGETPCRGGQHVGSGLVAVDLTRDGRRLRLISGFRSGHKTKKALEQCVHWTEVPLAVEAAGWRRLD
jgi:hypothetical protein